MTRANLIASIGLLLTKSARSSELKGIGTKSEGQTCDYEADDLWFDLGQVYKELQFHRTECFVACEEFAIENL